MTTRIDILNKTKKKMKLFLLGFAVGLFFSWSCITTFASGITVGIVLTLYHPSIGDDICSIVHRIANYSSYFDLSTCANDSTNDSVDSSTCKNNESTEEHSISPKDKLQ